tara:strand:- start:193 stop:597 length:405 start_codon:yes stop_codon:yes gene_type:complete
MRIEQNGAVTQSEKVRELIRMAREQVGSESFSRAYLSSSEVAAPILAECKSDPESRSDVCEALLIGVAEIAASVQATMRDDAFLRNLEQRLLPVAEQLVKQLLPALISEHANRLEDVDVDRKQRLLYLIETLTE